LPAGPAAKRYCQLFFNLPAAVWNEQFKFAITGAPLTLLPLRMKNYTPATCEGEFPSLIDGQSSIAAIISARDQRRGVF